MTVTRSGLVTAGLGVVAVGGLLYLLLFKSPPPPEELIRQKVIRMVRGAEKRQVGDVLEQVSPRFRSSDGMGKDELRGFLVAQLFRGSWVRIFLMDMDVKVTSPTSADFTGKFIFAQSEAKELKELARDSVMSSYEIDARVEREPDGEWRFVSASYQPVDVTQLF